MQITIVEVHDPDGDGNDREVILETTLAELQVVPGLWDTVSLQGREFMVYKTTVNYDTDAAVVVLQALSDDEIAERDEIRSRDHYRSDSP